jgi:hypothetical protein
VLVIIKSQLAKNQEETMLEILALLVLTKRIGKIVEEKGRKSGGYKILMVGLWFGGEIVGLILGTVIAGGDPSAKWLPYLIALLGAVIGAGIAYAIANGLSPVTEPTSMLSSPEQRS